MNMLDIVLENYMKESYKKEKHLKKLCSQCKQGNKHKIKIFLLSSFSITLLVPLFSLLIMFFIKPSVVFENRNFLPFLLILSIIIIFFSLFSFLNNHFIFFSFFNNISKYKAVYIDTLLSISQNENLKLVWIEKECKEQIKKQKILTSKILFSVLVPGIISLLVSILSTENIFSIVSSNIDNLLKKFGIDTIVVIFLICVFVYLAYLINSEVTKSSNKKFYLKKMSKASSFLLTHSEFQK